MEATVALGLLRESVLRIVSHETEVSVAYSGGLDSSIVAAIAGEFASVQCYTCAAAGSFDAGNAEERARSESLDVVIVELDDERLRRTLREAAATMKTSNPVQLAYTIPVLAALKESKQRLMLAGNGADELFGGYAKYASVRDPTRLMADDLSKMLSEVEMLKHAANAIGKEIGFPFTSREVIDFSSTLPLDRKVKESKRKILLREVASQLRLPSHDRPKKAAQYSSGVLKAMERLAKNDGKSLAEWTRSQAE